MQALERLEKLPRRDVASALSPLPRRACICDNPLRWTLFFGAARVKLWKDSRSCLVATSRARCPRSRDARASAIIRFDGLFSLAPLERCRGALHGVAARRRGVRRRGRSWLLRARTQR